MENFNEKDEIKKKAEELTKNIKESEAELDSLRKSCNHEEYTVKNVQEGTIGSYRLRKVCKFCEKEVGFPSEQDLKDNGYS